MTKNGTPDNRTLLQALIGDGRFLLLFTGLILVLSGTFVLVQSYTGHFLPHDITYLGMDAEGLSTFNNGTITKFMFHDRVYFGGSIIAVGLLYMWLVEFPLKNKEPWAWYLFLFSGLIGFGSFLTYLGYGYLDTWHGVATGLLLPFYFGGLFKSYALFKHKSNWRELFQASEKVSISNAYGVGKLMLYFTAISLFLGGVTIMTVGMTTVFVPQDLAYMNITVCGVDSINSNLKPLIAHDREAFGGGLATIGLLYFFIIRKSPSSIHLWQILALTLFVGFSSAICIHHIIGYTDWFHLLPAYTGAGISVIGLCLTYKQMHKSYMVSDASLFWKY